MSPILLPLLFKVKIPQPLKSKMQCTSTNLDGGRKKSKKEKGANIIIKLVDSPSKYRDV
jgi:hypothetical protein